MSFFVGAPSVFVYLESMGNEPLSKRRAQLLLRAAQPGGVSVGPRGEDAAALGNMEDDGLLKLVCLDRVNLVWVPA